MIDFYFYEFEALLLYYFHFQFVFLISFTPVIGWFANVSWFQVQLQSIFSDLTLDVAKMILNGDN